MTRWIPGLLLAFALFPGSVRAWQDQVHLPSAQEKKLVQRCQDYLEAIRGNDEAAFLGLFIQQRDFAGTEAEYLAALQGFKKDFAGFRGQPAYRVVWEEKGVRWMSLQRPAEGDHDGCLIVRIGYRSKSDESVAYETNLGRLCFVRGDWRFTQSCVSQLRKVPPPG